MCCRLGWRWHGFPASRRLLIGACCAVLLLFAPALRAQSLASVEDARVRVGFSNLVARLDEDEIGFAHAEYRVHILEALRAAGFNAVGAESLVFERDEGQRADLMLGGTVKELECRRINRRTNCRIGIEWELLDRKRDAVVYRVLTRHMEPSVDRGSSASTGRKLTLGALRLLMARARFKELLDRKSEVASEQATYPKATFAACPAVERKLPGQFDEVADATFVITQASGFGSGFAISPDGLVLTAAHVVDSQTVTLTPRGATAPLTGTVVRLSRKHDVALIAIAAAPGTTRPCLELQTVPPRTGDDVYAVGSPASKDLAFSMTRGIVSGVRLVDGVQLVQTDASLNPGNSGGPLLDRDAKVVGVVSRKIAGQALEGLGFGVEIQGALRALALEPGAVTNVELLAASLPERKPARRLLTLDAETPLPSLDPIGDRRRREAADHQRRQREQEAATPWFVKPMRWTGLAASIAGTIGIVYSTSSGNQERITRADFEKYRTQNDVSWAAFLLGTAAFAVSYPLEPRLPPSRVASRAGAARWSLGVGPAGFVEVGLAP